MSEQMITIPINLYLNLVADFSHAVGYIDGIKPDANHFYRDSLDMAMEGFKKALEAKESE